MMTNTQTPDVIFAKAVELKASDVHIAVNSPLIFRINGFLVLQTEEAITAQVAEDFVKAVLGETLFKRLLENREIDTAYQLKDGTRLRVNCHFERGNVGLVARVVPTEIPTIEELSLESVFQIVAHQDSGLILFTGPTGTGKSTSMAAILNHINQARSVSIVTLEDPIEFAFPEGVGLIRQRQYGEDFLSFPDALKHVLRQDPDIVMVGEMRDAETIATALTLAETGHLILATLHTPNTVQAVDRIIDVFPSHQQAQIRSQLSMCMRAVIAQRLVPKVGGGRVAQREILVNSVACANTIHDNRLPELMSVLQTSSNLGMVSFENDAKRLYKEGLIDKEVFEGLVEG